MIFAASFSLLSIPASSRICRAPALRRHGSDHDFGNQCNRSKHTQEQKVYRVATCGWTRWRGAEDQENAQLAHILQP